ncbi:MAG: ABC transporter substrate-binding protein, partial [Dehalococcoidia bacterium]
SSGGLASGPIGTGAFIFESAQDRVGWKARKNPTYFKKDAWTGKQLPYLDGIETSYFVDTNAALAAFRDKQLDVYYPLNRSLWMDVLKTNPEVITQITTPPPSYQPYIGIRVDKPPFNDVRVRRALSLAVNREDIIFGPFDGLAGYGYAQDWTYFGQEWPWAPEQLGQYMKFNAEEAKKLMTEAGFPEGIGRKLEIYHSAATGINFDTGQLVADMWKKNLGIDVVETVPPDTAAWQQNFYGVKYEDTIVAGVAGPSLDPDAYAYDPLHSKSTKNYFKVNDPQLDSLTEAQRVEFDTTKRQQLLKDIMARDLDQAYRLWTVTPYKINTRYPYLFNAVDQVHAWGPAGWGSKVCEMVWMNR